MALFSFKSKGKESGDGSLTRPDEILAYLDELVKKKSDIQVSTPTRSVRAKIFFLEEKEGLMRVQGEGIGAFMKGKQIECGFSLDRSYFSFPSRVIVKDNKSYLTLPEVIHHKERRSSQRAAFSAREQVKVTILENLGSGSGVFGHAIEVGTGGMSLVIDKAMVLDNEKEISPGPGLYKSGTDLMLVKVNRIPGCVPFECQGTARRIYKDGRWKLAISFIKCPSTAIVQIEKFVTSRSIPFKLVRRSRKKRSEADESNLVDVESPRETPSPEPQTKDPQDIKVPPPAEAEEPATIEPQPPPEMPAPQAEPVPPGPSPVIYSFGRELVPFLLFLKKRTDWHAENSFESLVQRLNSKRPDIIIFNEHAGGTETLNLIKKLNSTGLLNEVTVYWAHMESLNPKMHVKLRLAGVEKTLKIPVTDKPGLIEKLYQTLE